MPIIKKENDLENWIKSIGQSIINRAEDVARDTKGVSSVIIYANITPNKILDFDITKNYVIELVEDNKTGGE